MAKNTIKLKKYQDIINEYFAEGILSPGHLVAITATGGIVVNGIATAQNLMVALEDELQGRTTADAFAIGEPVQCWSVQPGEEALLRVTGAVTVGAQVELVADGTVQALAAGVAIGTCLVAAADGFVNVKIGS